jgi:glycine/D-amino acid oxidase-like deaminating enzyme
MLRRAVVLGGGIMGLASAWGLIRRGWTVTLVDQAALPNPHGSSVDEARLIRDAYGAARGYAAMVAEAHQAWSTLWTDLGRPLYHQTGVLALLREGEDDWGRQSIATLDALGAPWRILDGAAVMARWPHLRSDSAEQWLYQREGGVLLAGAIVGALHDWLAAAGARLCLGLPATAVDGARGRVTLADGMVLEGDIVVVAAGPWTSRLLPQLADRARPSLQVSLPMTAPQRLQPAWAGTPMLLDIDPDTGFYLVPPTPGSAMKAGDHRFSMTGDPDGPRLPDPAMVAAIRAGVAARLAEPEDHGFGAAKPCFYTVAPGERFHVAPFGPRGWALTGFSGHGFKFGAVIGLRLADTLSDGLSAEALGLWAAGGIASS